MSSPGDVNFKEQIFRKDFKQLVAKSIQRLVTMPVRLAYSADGYEAGTVLARDPADGYYKAYDDDGATGIRTAVCILADEVTAEESSGTKACVAIVHGELYNDKIVGGDSAANTDLGARTYTEADGTVIFSF